MPNLISSLLETERLVVTGRCLFVKIIIKYIKFMLRNNVKY